jgi:hypothetical protein
MIYQPEPQQFKHFLPDAKHDLLDELMFEYNSTGTIPRDQRYIQVRNSLPAHMRSCFDDYMEAINDPDGNNMF